MDQKQNQADIDTTANIRKQIVDAHVSIDAQNVKIITQNGKVTLRGPVHSEDEKQRLQEIAQSVAGADNVDNQLEIQP
jgi:osmotically-inducible protein OsmY